MTTYRATSDVPPLVRQATALAARLAFTHSCTPEVGRFLAVLAAGVGAEVVGEIGSGCGVGAAWIVSALPPAATFVTVECDATRAVAVRELLHPYLQARVLHDDWHALLSAGPFDLLFADGGQAKQEEPALLLDALRPGGTIVLDDLTPEEHWPATWRGRQDPVRAYWLNEPRLAATELLTTPTTALIVATRLS